MARHAPSEGASPISATKSSTAGTAPERRRKWFRENGPECPALLDHLRAHGRDYDLGAVLDLSLRPSRSSACRSSPIARCSCPPPRTIAPIDLDVLHEFFRIAGGLSVPDARGSRHWSRPAPGGRCSRRTSSASGSMRRGGDRRDRAAPRRLAACPADYVLYLGRVDRNKGCDDAPRVLPGLMRRRAATTTLVLAGPATMHDSAASADPRAGLRVADDAARRAAVPRARARRALAVREPQHRAAGGVEPRACRRWSTRAARCWRDRSAAPTAVCPTGRSASSRKRWTYLLAHEPERRRSGRQGLAYVEREYRWPTVLERVERLLEQVVAPRRAPSITGNDQFDRPKRLAFSSWARIFMPARRRLPGRRSRKMNSRKCHRRDPSPRAQAHRADANGTPRRTANVSDWSVGRCCGID